jgi:hypothetical protein
MSEGIKNKKGIPQIPNIFWVIYYAIEVEVMFELL